MRVEIACHTDVGLVRDHNEDYMEIEAGLGLVVLADGMGGYQAGEVASEIASNTIVEELTKPLKKLHTQQKKTAISNAVTRHQVGILLEQAVIKANEMVFECAEEEDEYRGMGTTVVAAVFFQDFVCIAHVGDSRLYRLRGNELTQLTTDHSVLQELIECGWCTPEQARYSPNRNLVTRALGVGDKVEVDVDDLLIMPKDIYLLCSDGLSDMVDDKEIAALIKENHTHLDRSAELLVDLANEKGGEDNISVILTRVLSESSHFPMLSWASHSWKKWWDK